MPRQRKLKIMLNVSPALAARYKALGERYKVPRSELFRYALERGYRSAAEWCQRSVALFDDGAAVVMDSDAVLERQVGSGIEARPQAIEALGRYAAAVFAADPMVEIGAPVVRRTKDRNGTTKDRNELERDRDLADWEPHDVRLVFGVQPCLGAALSDFAFQLGLSKSMLVREAIRRGLPGFVGGARFLLASGYRPASTQGRAAGGLRQLAWVSNARTRKKLRGHELVRGRNLRK